MYLIFGVPFVCLLFTVILFSRRRQNSERNQRAAAYNRKNDAFALLFGPVFAGLSVVIVSARRATRRITRRSVGHSATFARFSAFVCFTASAYFVAFFLSAFACFVAFFLSAFRL